MHYEFTEHLRFLKYLSDRRYKCIYEMYNISDDNGMKAIEDLHRFMGDMNFDAIKAEYLKNLYSFDEKENKELYISKIQKDFIEFLESTSKMKVCYGTCPETKEMHALMDSWLAVSAEEYRKKAEENAEKVIECEEKDEEWESSGKGEFSLKYSDSHDKGWPEFFIEEMSEEMIEGGGGALIEMALNNMASFINIDIRMIIEEYEELKTGKKSTPKERPGVKYQILENGGAVKMIRGLDISQNKKEELISKLMDCSTRTARRYINGETKPVNKIDIE